MELYDNIFTLDHHSGWGVHNISEQLTSLGVSIAPHASGQTSIEPTGYYEQGHVEIDLKADSGGQCIHVEEANGVGDGVLHKHALSIACDELNDGLRIIAQKDSRLVVPQVLDIELSEELAMNLDFLFVDFGCLEFACRHIQGDPTPGGGGQLGNLFKHGRRSSSKGDEDDAHLVQACQVCQGGQAGIEDQMGGQLAVSLFPEGNEAKDLLSFFPLSNIGVGIAESASVGVVCEKNQDAWLAPASG